MKTIVLKQHSHSQSGKKAQVMSVDSSISYFLFALFLIYMSDFILDISEPYSSQIRQELLYKNSEALEHAFTTNDVSREYLNNICTTNYTKVISTRAKYETKGVILPAYDEQVNDTKLGLHIQRQGNKARITFNTNTTANLSIIIITNNEVIITEENTEPNDEYTKTKNQDTTLISIQDNNTMGDKDTYEITINDSVILFLDYENMEQSYIGLTPLAYNCGRIRSLPKKTYYSNYAILEEKQVIVEYGVEVWWE